MSFNAALISSLVIAFGVQQGAGAQIEADSMGDLNAWGQRYLSSDEPEFPTNLWQESTPEALLDLMRSVRTAQLNPAERKLLRRVILSPAAQPTGEAAEALAQARARLMLELGEARAAAALVPQFEPSDATLDPETLIIDLDLASGQEATACGALTGPVKQAPYWLKLRAVCAVLQENYSGAQLAIEVAAAQGVEDSWLVEAIFAAAGDAPNAPGARFDSGLNIALSAKAGLDPSATELSTDRPALAAAALQRPDIPMAWQTEFAKIASANNLIPDYTRRALLLDRLAGEDYTPINALEQALSDFTDPLVSDAARAETLTGALAAAAVDGQGAERGVAQLLLAELKSLPQTAETAPFAVELARASLLAGAPETAGIWLNGLDFEGVEAPEPFQLALVEAALIMAGGDASPASLKAVESRLILAATSSQREDRVARVFTLWTGLGLPLSPIARDFVVLVSDRGDRVSQGQLTGLKAAQLSGAVGEAVLMILAITNGDAERLAASDLAVLLTTLIALEAEDIARELALEASGYWLEGEE